MFMSLSGLFPEHQRESGRMTHDVDFVTGLEISRQVAELIAPGLRGFVPGIPLALALFGPGSDVLGYDTARSMDHDWGPRLTIVVPETHRTEISQRIDANIRTLLPESNAAFPTRFSFHADGTMYADPAGNAHRLTVTSVDEIVRTSLLIDSLEDMDDAVWLSTPMQLLLELVGGDVFVDDSGELTGLRENVSFYPDHIWRYQLAGLWMRIGQIQPFIGRTGEVGDQAGSATIAASIVRDLMRIALLQSRQYAPYAKWLGTAVTRTPIGEDINPHLEAALAATDWRAREHAINLAGIALIEQLNSLDLIPGIQAGAAPFHSRPFQVLPAEGIASALRESIATSGLTNLRATMGGIDVVTDSTDALGSHEFRRAFRSLF